MRDRQPIIDDFRDGKFELLVASEVASEGLDFEFCNVLVNYDLPWNPMRVEQRIGRLDRFLPEAREDPDPQHARAWHHRVGHPGTAVYPDRHL